MPTFKFSKKQVESGKKLSQKEWDEAIEYCFSCKSTETGYYRTNCNDCCGKDCWHEVKNGRMKQNLCCVCYAKKGYNEEHKELSELNVPADIRNKLIIKELRDKFWKEELKLLSIDELGEDKKFNKPLFVKNNSELICLNYKKPEKGLGKKERMIEYLSNAEIIKEFRDRLLAGKIKLLDLVMTGEYTNYNKVVFVEDLEKDKKITVLYGNITALYNNEEALMNNECYKSIKKSAEEMRKGIKQVEGEQAQPLWNYDNELEKFKQSEGFETPKQREEKARPRKSKIKR
jgi:hypothetical protein